MNINKHIKHLNLTLLLKDWSCEIDDFDICSLKLTNLNGRIVETHFNLYKNDDIDQIILKKIVKIIWNI